MLRDRRTATFLFMNLGHAYDHMFMLIFPTAVLALGKDPDFGGSYGDLLSLSVYGFVAFGVGALPAGWLGDRWSRRGMMIVFFVGLGLSSVATGLAAGPLSLAVGLTFIGLFASIYHPVGVAIVAENAKRLGKAMGVNGVFGNLGIAFAAITAGALADLFGWRAAFIVPGAVAVATGAAYAFLGRPAPEAHVAREAGSHTGIPRAVQRRVFTVMALAVACGGMIFNATTVSLPKVFEVRLADFVATTTEVGGMVTLVISAAAFVQVLVGHLIDRYPLKRVFVLVSLLQVPVMVLAIAASGLPMLGLGVVMMMLVFGQIPIQDTIVARFTTAAWRSRVYAMKYVLSLGVAAAAVPLVAFVHDATGGFGQVFFVLAGFAAAVLVVSLAFPGRAGIAAPVPG